MDLHAFQNLAPQDVAAIVQAHGPRVVVCPVNGTRRWYALESRRGELPGNFLDAILAVYLDLFALFYSHGIETLLTPVFGPDLAGRGGEYTQMVVHALGRITEGELFRSFYAQHEVRVRFYGDYTPFFSHAAPETLSHIHAVQENTALHTRRRLYWGMFAHDPAEQLARIAVDFQQATGRLPRRSDLVEAYYGAPLPPADLFIGMQPASVFDYPLLDVGTTALYFTTAPTPYLDEPVLRRILYDYLFVRPGQEDYAAVDQAGWDALDALYLERRWEVSGVGQRSRDGQFWLPDDRINGAEADGA